MRLRDYIKQRAAESVEASNRRTELEKAASDEQHVKLAYKNGYDAFFDGLKYVGDPDKPLPVELPMMVKPSIFYKHAGVRYVCMRDGICTEETFHEFMEQF